MKSSTVFVTGTDTDVGKTFIAALLTKAWGANYWKPMQTGLESDTGDTSTVRRLTGLPEDHFKPPQVALQKPLSPWRAVVLENTDNISLENIHIPKEFQTSERPLVIEGAGGLYVPINDKHMMTDLIQKLDIPVILVARSELGTINHTLLSLDALTSKGIKVLGVIMNGKLNHDNAKTIEHFAGGVPILCEIPETDPSSLEEVLHLIPKLDSLIHLFSQF